MSDYGYGQVCQCDDCFLSLIDAPAESESEECKRCGDEMPSNQIFDFGITKIALCIGCVRKAHQDHFCTRGLPSECPTCKEAQECESKFANVLHELIEEVGA